MFGYLGFAFMLPVFRRLLLVMDEEDYGERSPQDVEWSRQKNLLYRVAFVASRLADQIKAGRHLYMLFGGDGYRVYKRGVPRIWALRTLFGHRRVRMVRLIDMVRPLWLGEDGRIYFGYGTRSDSIEEEPSWCMEANLMMRGSSDLQRLLNALEAELADCRNHDK